MLLYRTRATTSRMLVGRASALLERCWVVPSNSISFAGPGPSDCLRGYRYLGSTRHAHSYQDAPSSQERRRHEGILVHPDSIGAKILPGGTMVSRTTRDGRVQTRYTELVHGYFWMLKDLRRTQEKPVLANTDALIPSSLAQILPDLPRVQPLLLDTTTNAATHSGGTVDFPAHLLRQNRSRDPSAQCTLLAIAFRDFGFQQLASWIVPFSDAYAHNDRVQVATLLVSEGWLNRMLLRPVIVASTRRNTPPEQRSRTYLHFGSSPHVEEWRDALRLHNVLVGYVLLLDGLGRVRFAASGTATETELAALMQGARDLLVSPTETNSPRTTVGNRSAPRTSSSFRIAQTRRPVRR